MLNTELYGTILMFLSLFGVLANWSVIFIIRKLPLLNSSFGILTASQSIGDGIHSLMFLLYVSPMVIMDSDWMSEYSMHCGAILIFCYNISILSHFLISCNRLIAVYSPMQYNKMFNRHNTYVASFVVFIISLLSVLILYIASCRFYYGLLAYRFTYNADTTCINIAYYFGFCKYVTVIVVIVIIDMFTILKVKRERKRTNTQSNEKTARENSFLRQILFQGAIFVIELVVCFIISPMFQSELLHFFASLIAWCFVHASDGVVTLYCNIEFRNNVKKRMNLIAETAQPYPIFTMQTSTVKS